MGTALKVTLSAFLILWKILLFPGRAGYSEEKKNIFTGVLSCRPVCINGHFQSSEFVEILVVGLIF